MDNEPAYKPVNLRPNRWKELKALADELAAESNMSVSLPDAIAFAVKFTQENRKKAPPNGTQV